jgi:D-amino-acid dehydrogenase
LQNHLPNRTADIVIVGGGVIGLSIAYYTALEGASVILIERDRIPCGSSYGNAGLIVPSHCEPLAAPGMIAEGLRQIFDPSGAFSIRLRPDPTLFKWLWRFYRFCNPQHFFRSLEVFKELMDESMRLHMELAQKKGSFYEYAQTGLLHLFETSKPFRKARTAAIAKKSYGVESRFLSGRQVQDLDPAIDRKMAGAVFFEANAQMNPGRFLEWLAGEVKTKGGRILTETEVFGYDLKGRRVDAVRTTRGVYRPDQVVVAAGAHTPSVLKGLGVKVPIQPAKGYSLTFQQQKGMPKIPIILEEGHIAMTPLEKTFRITGILELCGLDRRILPERIKTIFHHAKGYFPAIEKMKLLEIWRGFRPCTPDGLPMIGRAAPFKNLWIAGGHATKGMTLGPVTGRLMSDMLAGKSVGPMAQILRVNRF